VTATRRRYTKAQATTRTESVGTSIAATYDDHEKATLRRVLDEAIEAKKP